jgi:geranylgeranyl pyrophosphate synthase
MKAMLTTQQVHRLLCRHGKAALEAAQKIILEEDIENRNVRARESKNCYAFASIDRKRQITRHAQGAEEKEIQHSSRREITKEAEIAKKLEALLERHGKAAFEEARKEIVDLKIGYRPLYDALRYFLDETWYGIRFPSLISLTCHAVGGKEEDSVHVAAAMVLMAGGVDIHDDVIDNSKIKGSKPTVFGKYGKDLAIVAGDILLISGVTLLHEACTRFPTKRRKAIMYMTEKASLELGSAEAEEMTLKGKLGLPLKEYLKVIKMKASVVEAYAKIGAVAGGGPQNEIRALGQYGRTLGILTTIRDDFIDIFEPEELENRLRNESLPLPLLYALKNKNAREEITSVLQKERLTEEETYALADLIWDLEEVNHLRREIRNMLGNAVRALRFIKKPIIYRELSQLLRITVEGLE